jgi:poly(A) polymerase
LHDLVQSTPVEPLLIPRAEHPISRRHIDPDALKVLYRLHQHHYKAYLVGGSVRDLLLGRQPKDFDIGTSAHPYEVKRLFRQCWIIGRRFRLAHVKFGSKTIEVATFRRKVPLVEDALATDGGSTEPEGSTPIATGVRVVHHDNTFGTPEEDAFRRDFTLNALFYDIATFGIIDYTGGLADLRAGLIRCIGDPDERFVEDPVRMLRAVALEARLDFQIDPPILEAIERRRLELGRSSPPRLIEEFYKILRAGVSTRAFRGLRELGLLEAVAPELQFKSSDELWQSLTELDTYRQDPAAAGPPSNPILLGSLLVPLGFQAHWREGFSVGLGNLPLARRDVERLRHILQLQRRLVADVAAPLRVRRAVMHRSAFPDALTWLAIHGRAPAVVDAWRSLTAESAKAHGISTAEPTEDGIPRRRRRRRRRRGRFQRPKVEF